MLATASRTAIRSAFARPSSISAVSIASLKQPGGGATAGGLRNLSVSAASASASATARQRRTIATTPVAQIEQTAVVQSEGEYAQTKDTVIQDYIDVNERDPDDYGHSTTGPGVGRHRSRTLESLSLRGKVCVVTGAARGLGNLMARTLVESGADALAIIDLDEEISKQAAKDVEAWFVEHGEASPGEVQAIGIGCDISNEDSVKNAMQAVVDRFGHIDVMVNSAGIVHNYPALDYPTEKMRQLNGINLDGAFFCAREAARHMIGQKRPGSIVLVGSMSGSIVNIPQPQVVYNVSKAGVKHMATSLAVEWAKNGIRVNSLAPGYMVTSLTRTILDNNPELEATWTSLTPMGRLGAPEDLKGAIVFLASDASSFVTGTEVTVDGGYVCT